MDDHAPVEEEKSTSYLRSNTVSKEVQPKEAPIKITNDPMDDPTLADFKWLDGPDDVVIHPHRRIGVVASFPTSFGTFTCEVDSTTGSPYQDCINTIAHVR